MDVQPPEKLRKPVHNPNMLLMSAGPSNTHPRVLEAMAQPALGCIQTEMFEIMDGVREGIKYLFQTKNSLTFALSSSGHGGIECTFANLLEPGETLIVARCGYWGDRAAEIAGYHDVKLVTLSPNEGDVNGFSLAELEEAVRKHKPKLLYIVQGESAIGLLQPLDGIGEMCHKYNCLLAVDGVASIGSTPMFMDRWEIDALFTGSQKALGVPPGLAPISFSSRAKDVIYNRRVPMSIYWFDVRYYSDQWGCEEGSEFRFHHTFESNSIVGLRESLAMVVEDGLEKGFERQREAVQHLYRGLEERGFKYFIPDENKRLPSVTTVYVPEGINNLTVYNRMVTKHNIEVGRGRSEELMGKIFRIGVMGYNAKIETVDHFFECFDESLEYAKSVFV